jgi:hypothetical protein
VNATRKFPWQRVGEVSPFFEMFLIVSEMQKVKWKHFQDARAALCLSTT